MVTTSPEKGRLADAVPSLVDIVQDYVRERITSGILVPGDRLKERDLAEETGISRVPIRDALRILAFEGFVTLNPRRGAVVASLEPEDLDEIYEVREALEAQEAALAALRATPDEIALMMSYVDEASRAWADGDRRTADQANVAFHALLVQMTHNDVLAKTLEPLQNRLNWLLRQNTDPGELCFEHRGMAEAIAAGDAETARRLALRHVATSKKVALQLLFGSRPGA